MYIKAFWRPLVSNRSSLLSTTLVSDPPCSHRLAAWSFKWKTWSSVSTFDIILQESVFLNKWPNHGKCHFWVTPLKSGSGCVFFERKDLKINQNSSSTVSSIAISFCGPVCIYVTQQRVVMKFFHFFFEIWIISRESFNLTFSLPIFSSCCNPAVMSVARKPHGNTV